VKSTIKTLFTRKTPEKMIGDKAYDSDTLDQELKIENNIDLIAPHRNNRVKGKTQDNRVLRRYKRRWKVGSAEKPLPIIERMLIHNNSTIIMK
jgi:hypothetical protein